MQADDEAAGLKAAALVTRVDFTFASLAVTLHAFDLRSVWRCHSESYSHLQLHYGSTHQLEGSSYVGCRLPLSPPARLPIPVTLCSSAISHWAVHGVRVWQGQHLLCCCQSLQGKARLRDGERG